ncbi:phosphoenolpyruvate synthase [Candidatus Woesearchaeota archaeon]|jgi:pyruvate, water dikinase|nr:phosphoenolpyruvate synthase [Candidatus Woesearchaeota archaeon]
MTNIIWFKDISKEDVGKVGGKGANLGEMFNAQFPIPNGFVVTAQAYKLFLEQTGIQSHIGEILRNTDVENNDQLQSASKKIQDLILKTEMSAEIVSDIKKAYENMNVSLDLANVSKQALDFIQTGRDNPFVAVRSSATAEDLPEFSFAGQQATYLNVKKSDHVSQAVHQCWASLYTARAIYYREKNNFDHNKVFIAVVVQRMVDSEKAGVMFSINPATNNEDEIIIEAGFGFGDSVVSGAISPDNYVVDKHTFEIKNKTINNKEFMFYRDPNTGRTNKRILSHEKANMQVLNESEIIQIAKLAKKSEDYYNNPQDMEFAIAGNKVFMVQTRAITTQAKVSEAVSKKVEEIDGKEILNGISASPGVGKGKVKIINNADELSKITEGDVLVAKMTNPDYVSAMQKASAIVTDEGGATCHAAIVSREMGIPSVVGTQKATEVLKEGQEITVDGTNGKIYSGDKKIEASKDDVSSEEIVKYQHEHTATEIKVIVDMPDLAEKAANTDADGIGLLRAEFMILGQKEHPVKLINEGRKEELVNRLEEDLTKIVTPFKEKRVWYRTLDAPTDEFRHLSGGEDEPKEDNPMMGWRSIRRDLDQPELLRAQLEAIKKVRSKGFDKLGLMIPLVSHVEQIKLVKAVLKELEMEDIEFGIMVETPASVQMIEEFCQEGINFASIGSNDLTQFTLAVDRNNAKIQKLYNAMHPAVLKEISQVIKICKRYKVESSLCGQAGSDPDMARFLVEKGIDSIAVNIDAVGKVRHAVAEKEKKMLLDVARG